MPASSPGERVARPAATISGVLFSTFVSDGSAPSATSAFISSASAVSAARRNGVAPSSFKRVLFRFTRLRHPRVDVRACATSFFTSSRLVIVPEPSGPGSLSPTPGLRTYYDHVQRRVAGSIGVRIGAGVEQLCRQLEMRVRDGQEQRRGAGPDGRHPREASGGSVTWTASLTSSAGLQQRSDHVDVSLSHRKEQRRKAGIRAASGSRRRPR